MHTSKLKAAAARSVILDDEVSTLLWLLDTDLFLHRRKEKSARDQLALDPIGRLILDSSHPRLCVGEGAFLLQTAELLHLRPGQAARG